MIWDNVDTQITFVSINLSLLPLSKDLMLVSGLYGPLLDRMWGSDQIHVNLQSQWATLELFKSAGNRQSFHVPLYSAVAVNLCQYFRRSESNWIYDILKTSKYAPPPLCIMHYLQYWTGVNPQKSLDSGLVSNIPLCKTVKRGTRLMDFSPALWVHGSRAATCAKQTAEQLLGVNCLFKGAQCEAGYRSTPWTWNPLNGSFIQPCRLLPELTSSHLIGSPLTSGTQLKKEALSPEAWAFAS